MPSSSSPDIVLVEVGGVITVACNKITTTEAPKGNLTLNNHQTITNNPKYG